MGKGWLAGWQFATSLLRSRIAFAVRSGRSDSAATLRFNQKAKLRSIFKANEENANETIMDTFLSDLKVSIH
jgi:hypothetical protein